MDNGVSSYRRFLSGDDEGLTLIIKEYKDGLILYLNSYVNNIYVAEEIMEETFQNWKGIQVIRLKGLFTEQDEFLKGSLLDTFTRNFRMLENK